MVSAFIFIADGTEEMEFTVTYDTLVRAGAQCTSVFVPSIHGNEDSPAKDSPIIATCSRGVKIIADKKLGELHDLMSLSRLGDIIPFEISHLWKDHAADVLVIPGGAKGADTISQNTTVQSIVQRQIDHGKLVGMICAGSLAAKRAGLPRQPITSHPSVKSELEEDFEYSEEPVVVSGNLITSRGPGTAFPFALKLVELVFGPERRAEVQGPMIFP